MCIVPLYVFLPLAYPSPSPWRATRTAWTRSIRLVSPRLVRHWLAESSATSRTPRRAKRRDAMRCHACMHALFCVRWTQRRNGWNVIEPINVLPPSFIYTKTPSIDAELTFSPSIPTGLQVQNEIVGLRAASLPSFMLSSSPVLSFDLAG